MFLYAARYPPSLLYRGGGGGAASLQVRGNLSEELAVE